MRRGPTIALMIGMPHGEEEPGQDEDTLNREQGDDGDGDIAEQAIMGIVECLHQRGPGAVARIRQYAQALEGMCDAYMERDHAGLEDAAADAHQALSKLISD
jgi:hypothetical protein